MPGQQVRRERLVAGMDKQLTLGSLFSGSGGFELAGMLNGIKPVWLSEIEPFASLVTAKRFPNVTHYGDISTLNGADLEPVDIITWGSPCQDYPEKIVIPRMVTSPW